MSYSGPGLTPSNDSDISAYKRLESKILAEERALNPDFSNSSCPRCVARFTKHVHFREDGHNDVIEDQHYEADAEEDREESGRSSIESTRGGAGSERRKRFGRLPKRVGRRSSHEGEEELSFHGAFR